MGTQRFLGKIAMAAASVAVLASCSWSEVKVVPASKPATAPADPTAATPAPAQVAGDRVIDHTVKSIDGEDVSLSSYRGKLLLIVNTASQCGLTPQYEQLQQLQEKYTGRGFTVLGFPCNDFAGQEPGSAAEIKSFCSGTYQVTFPLFEKVRAKGDKSPLYKTLTEEIEPSLRGEIKWNFTKFLVDASGHVVARFEPLVKPLDPQVIAEIEKRLPQ